MKKIIAAFAVLAILIPAVSSCKKDKKENKKPSIELEASTIEIGSEMSCNVTISVPEGLDVLQIEATVPVTLVGIINQYVGTAANKATAKAATAILDVLDDTTVSSKLLSLKVTKLDGKNLRGKTSVTLDLAALVNALTDGQIIDNNSDFKFNIKVTDKGGNSLSRTATFHWTSGPEINSPESVNAYAAKPGCKITVSAKGKIKELYLIPSGDNGIEEYVKKRTANGTSTIDLCTDAKAESNFGLPSINKILGKETVTLDLDALLNQFQAESTTAESKIQVLVIDNNGKEASADITIICATE